LSAKALIVLLAGTIALSSVLAAPQASPLARLSHDADIAELLGSLRDHASYGVIRIDNVQVVDPAESTITAQSTIIVGHNRFYWVGKTADAPDLPVKLFRIDGHGRFAVPGLSDMHIHSTRADGWLLNIAVGVTTVRDMDGFPWMLRARDQINAGKMLGPTDYVAGTIIASQPLDGYAVVVANPADARRVVRQQAACGYDFIKVHNQLRQTQLDAIAEQAHALGIDLVGHVPHDISLDHALHVDRMRTTEHLKGFLLDQTLLPSDEDYAAALANTQTWFTPTLYTRRGYDRGDWARGFMAGPLPAYAPPDVRARWAGALAHPDKNDLILGPRFENTQNIVMTRLLPFHLHWLTGTDAEGYTFGLMGFGLLDELHLMQSEGLSAAEVLRASTVEAADAMRETGEFGKIAKGYRADLVLLDQNPLADVAALDRNEGVLVHGHWLDRPSLDEALARLASIYADGRPVPQLSEAPVKALIGRVAKAQADGFVFDDTTFVRLADALRKAGHPALAKSVEALEVAIPASACYVPAPTD
jgi:hypothetical protein